MKANVIWQPLPSQRLFLSCPAREALFDGTRGPGKSDALLMAFAQEVGKGWGAAYRGLIFRRQHKDLQDLVARSREWFHLIFPGAVYNESNQLMRWRWPGGETLYFRHAQDEADYWTYHGQQFAFIGYDELTTWPDLKFYDRMKSVLRSTTPGMPLRIRATSNPWGVGHNAVKGRFIDPAPAGTIIQDKHGERCRIFGSMIENRHLMDNDPDYVRMLLEQTDPNIRKAWLMGDWDVISGGMFDDVWRAQHNVVEPFEIPHTWRIDRSFDWGSSSPYSVGYWAESDGSDYWDNNGLAHSTQRGDLYRIDEIYGWTGEPNTGTRELAVEVAAKIKDRDKLFRNVRGGPADTQIYERVNGVCIGDDMAQKGVHWERADKRAGTRKTGWELMRRKIKNAWTREGPGLFVFNTCRQFVRTVPVLPRSEKDPEDVDSEAEDHIADESRYRVLSSAARPGKRRIGGH